MALGPFPPLSVKGIQEPKARGGAQQQSQPGAGAAQDSQARHDAPAARVSHANRRGGGGGEIRERDPPTPTPNPWRCLLAQTLSAQLPHPNLDPKTSASPEPNYRAPHTAWKQPPLQHAP